MKLQSKNYLLTQIFQPIQTDFPFNQQLVDILLSTPNLHHETRHRCIKTVRHYSKIKTPPCWILLMEMKTCFRKTLNVYGLQLFQLGCTSFCSLTKRTHKYIKLQTGLPWWRSGWESACQCRGHGFEPWSGKIPHAAEQLGP